LSFCLEDITTQAIKIAFLSTPSLYFSCSPEFRTNCKVFDYDKKWENDKGFVHYDFNSPLDMPTDLKGAFDMVVIDAPFITSDVLGKYATTTKYLLGGSPSGEIIST
jgi:hypothetical protein